MDSLNTPEFAARIEQLLDQWHVPGLAIALTKDDQTISKGFGHATLDPPTPCTADSIFDIASASKSLTAASVALLIADEENYPKVQWEATMSSLLPDDFVMADPYYTKNVTVEDILSHRTGLPRHDDSYLGVNSPHTDNAKSVTRNLRNLPISAPLRSKFQYNNMMYTVASYLVEALSKTPFAEFQASHFFKPLGMDSTHLQPSTVKAVGLGDRLVTPYRWNKDTNSFNIIPLQECPEGQGAGSIMTTVNDYIKYVKALMHHEAPFTEQMVKDLTRSRLLCDPDSDDLNPFHSWTAYGAGWETYFYRGHKVICHDGGVPGYCSVHFFLPKQKFGGVIFSNSSQASGMIETVVHELLEEVLGISKDEVDWNALYDKQLKDYQKESEGELEKTKKELYPEYDGTSLPQTRPLEAYTGRYTNAGYHDVVVEVRDGKLYIDCSDRSFDFYFVFEHVAEETKYVAHLINDHEGDDSPLKAEFKFEDGNAVRLGIDMESALDDLTWFDRVDKE